MAEFTVAICSYNRAYNLPNLISTIRGLSSPVPFEILVVDNNSTDSTQEVLKNLSIQSGAPLRFVHEKKQGISYARNRALSECRNSLFMAFIDDDELPGENFISSSYDALCREGADCVGGKIEVDINKRPKWLTQELLGFLGELDYSKESFWINEKSKPVFTGNIAYKMEIFKKHPELTFDLNFNRVGEGVGGGEDVAMFYKLLEYRKKIRYRPDMKITHLVEDCKLKRRYFIKLHFIAGKKKGQFKSKKYSRTFFGVPFFIFNNIVRDWLRTFFSFVKGKPTLRQAMNASYITGMAYGYFRAKL